MALTLHNVVLMVSRRMWWRKWKWGIAAAGFAVFLLAFSLLSNSNSRNTHFQLTDLVPLTLLRNAKERGACNSFTPTLNPHFLLSYIHLYICVIKYRFMWCYICLVAVCLDGSLPGYHFQQGFGSGSQNWLLHIEVTHLFPISNFITHSIPNKCPFFVYSFFCFMILSQWNGTPMLFPSYSLINFHGEYCNCIIIMQCNAFY